MRAERSIAMVFVLGAALTGACGEDTSDSSGPSSSVASSSTSSGSGGGSTTSVSTGTGGQDLGPCLPAAEPFGTDPGASESFPDIKLTLCNGTKETVDQIPCRNQITLISIGAGWCEPCKAETPQLEAAALALAGQGIGIVQVMFQDGQSSPATTLFCETWVDQFSLTIPVYIDPPGNTLAYFDSASAPLNVVVDHDGKVLWAETGIVPEDLEGLLVGMLPK